jgi:UDP-glucose 4-epimerase
MNILVTGGAGFIGSHLVDFLVKEGHRVTVLDNFSSGKASNLDSIANRESLRIIRADIKDQQSTMDAVRGQELVFHFCDNSDIRFAATHTRTYLDQNVLGLFYVLEGMREHGVRNIAFPSSTTVLGDAKTVPTPEHYGPLQPMNIYGGAKMACEALLSAYSFSFDMKSWIFRFVDIVGARIDHGVIYDFVRKLTADPKQLEILGDGSQRRSFLLVGECVEAMWLAINRLNAPVNLVHIGNEDQVSITEVGRLVQEAMCIHGAHFAYTGGNKGWKGDAFTNFIYMDTLRNLGWRPRMNSADSVREAATQVHQGLMRHSGDCAARAARP